MHNPYIQWSGSRKCDVHSRTNAVFAERFTLKNNHYVLQNKVSRSLCNAFSRDWSNGKNTPSSRDLQESHAFIGADVTGDGEPKQAC
ncbi:hypothetical protein AVEN_151317-1 [Araneus ventricosus]|uniref:Uncharacterized protein n=1 Tax=Araneus ventricosus TaxID=182803 RepID=A0A4Y2EC05_ARAVE|nr:hypothetical protein AVEN_151317-1 [Araneus ventricosus]